MKNHLSMEDFVEYMRPTGSFICRDMRAIAEGQRVPPHVQFEAWVLECSSWCGQADNLAQLIRQAVKYLQYRLQLKGATVAKTEGTVFIGHGGSPAWRDLKD